MRTLRHFSPQTSVPWQSYPADSQVSLQPSKGPAGSTSTNREHTRLSACRYERASTSFAQSAASAACLEALPTCKGQSGQLLAPATTAAIIPSWASSSSASSPHGEENIYQRMSSCDGHTFTISGPAAELEPFEECDRVACTTRISHP